MFFPVFVCNIEWEDVTMDNFQLKNFFTGQKNGPIVINKFCCAVSPRQPAKHV